MANEGMLRYKRRRLSVKMGDGRWKGFLASFFCLGAGQFLQGRRKVTVLALLNALIVFPFFLLLLALSFVPVGLALGLLTASWLISFYFLFDAWRPTPSIGLRRWIILVAVGLFLSAGARGGLLKVFGVYREFHSSMTPTIQKGDAFFSLRAAYWFSTPRRGDIVVYLTDNGLGARIILEKRLIGLPGDVLSLKDGVLSVNGAPYRYPGQTVDYAPGVNSSVDYSLAEEQPLTVPKGMMFVLGDNPASSFDSRYSGPIPLEALKAKAEVVLWPFGHLKRISN